MSRRAPSPQELAVGRPLPWPIHDRNGKLLLKQGAVIHSEAALAAVLERGLVEERDLQAGSVRDRDEPIIERVDDAESRSIYLLLRRLPPRLESVLQAFRQPGSARAAEQCCQLVEELQQACERDLDAALAALQIDASEDVGSTAASSLHGALLCEMLARALGMERERRGRLMCAALTHDVGMFPLADSLVRQKLALSSAQREALQHHTEMGCELLQEAGVAAEDWLRAVAEHHERIDGSGYPCGLRGEQISPAARLLALVDIYSAMIRPRAYRDALPCREVLRELFLERGKRVDEALAELFIREIGLFPPGSLVRLQNGEVAMVTRRGASAASPQLRAVISASGVPVVRPPLRDASEPCSRIVGCEPVSRYRSVLTRAHELWDDPTPQGAAQEASVDAP